MVKWKTKGLVSRSGSDLGGKVVCLFFEHLNLP